MRRKIKMLENYKNLKKGEIVTIIMSGKGGSVLTVKKQDGTLVEFNPVKVDYKLYNDSMDDKLSDKELLKLAKQVNWNEDKMLDELRKLNLDVSNSDLQAIVEGFLLLNKPIIKDSKEFKYPKNSLKIGQTFKTGNETGKILKLEWDARYGYDVLYFSKRAGENVWTSAEHNFTADSTERLKSYNIKNHSTGVTYKVKAKSFKDAKDKYERYLKDRNSFEYKGYLVIKSSYGWKVKINNRIMEFTTDKEAREYIDSAVKDSFTRDNSSRVNQLKKLANTKYVRVEFANKTNPDRRGNEEDYVKYYVISTSPSEYEKTAKLLEQKGEKVIRGLNYNLYIRDSFAEDSDDLYILTKQNHKAVNYKQALDYGDKHGLHQVFRVDKREFNSLVKTAKSANVRNPNEWAFNRLHRERKTKTFDSFSEDANIKYYAQEVKSWSREDFIDERDELLRMLDKAETQAQKEGHRNFEKRINNIQVKLDEVRYIIKNRLFSKDSLTEDASNIQISKSSKEFERVIREYHKKYGKILQVESMVYNFETGKYYMYNESTDYSFTSKRLVDSITEDAKWDTLLANLGFAHNQGTGDIQIWKYRDKDRNKFEKAIEHIRRVDRKLILSASSQSSGEHKITIMKPANDSFSEDATLAQLEIKNTFLEENENADDVIYIGNNEERKISFYSYGDKYFAFFDLENRVEVITKDEVQRILKKNIIEASEKESDELFGEGDLGIAATVRAEDDKSITLSQFSPDKLIKAVIDNKQSMNNYVKAPDGNTYFIAVYSDFVSVVRIEPDGKQKRVVDKSFTRFNFEEALVILKGIEKQLGQGGYR